MKVMKLFIVLVVFLLGMQKVEAQYVMTMQNGILSNPQPNQYVFQFDVYVASTGSAFTLTSYQVCFSYNPVIVNGGTLTFSYVSGSSALANPPFATNIVNDISTPNLVSASFQGADNITTTPVKVGTFKLINTKPFGANCVNNLAWDFTGPFYVTEVNISNVNQAAPSHHFNALSPYVMNLQNGVQTSASSYNFDIYLSSSSVDFTMTSFQVSLTYNSAIANGGTLTYSYVPGSSALTSCLPLSSSIQVINDGGTSNLLFGSAPGSQLVTLTPIKVGTFTISNSVPFGMATPDITWDFAGTWKSIVNLNYTDVTLPVNHQNSLSNSPLPVELTTFNGTSAGSDISLNWSTATEVNNYGFEIERKTEKSDWVKVGFIKGNGNSNSPKNYSFTDSPLGDVKFQYRLKQVDFNGGYKYYDAIEVKLELPANYALHQNFPNPFNPTTVIKFDLPKQSKVSLKVYNILGAEVSTLVDDIMNAGHQEITFDASKLASGMYIYTIQAGKFFEVKKMLLMK